MTETSSLLIVDGDREFVAMLAAQAASRAYSVQTAGTIGDAIALIHHQSFDAILVDLAPAAETAFELLAELKRLSADTEVVVMSERVSMATTIQWFDPEAFAFVRKSDVLQLFSTLARALERRRMTTQNRRLLWELQTINEIASGISRSLELDDVLVGALQQLVRAMDANGGSLRLVDERTGAVTESTMIGPPAIQDLWNARLPGVDRPSDRVLATRRAIIVEDFAAVVDAGMAARLPIRSAISVPLLAGDDILGTLSLGSLKPRRFQQADQQLLARIAAQIVVAIQNARLHYSIRRAKREWERTFDAISDPIAVFNDRGDVLRGNRALAAHLSLPVTALRQLTCRQVGFCDGEHCPDCAVGRALNQQQSCAEVTLPDGRIFSVTTFSIGPASDGPSVVQVAKNVTDEIRSARRLQQMSNELAGTNARLLATVDQLKSTQAQLVQSEKLSAIGQLVAGVAHELNNPLTSVIGYAQLVEEELRQGPAQRPVAEMAHDMRRIAQESERAARIVRNLLAFARRQGAARAPQDIADVAARVLALRQYSFTLTGVELVTDIPEQLPKVYADGGQLQQVLLNLVLNAEQAMRGRPVRRLSISARYDDEANAIELSVADSGHGIDAANLSRIFDPFFTTRDVGEGTGLGLSICYGIVRDHGGLIAVESRPGDGTSFRVTLPASTGRPDAADCEVLVAHTEPSEREFLEAVLRGWGYRPISATTVQEALKAYERNSLHFAVLDRSVLALDLAAWRACRADGRRLPLVLTSITPDDSAVEQFGRQESAAVVAAPLELRALHAAIGSIVKECV